MEYKYLPASRINSDYGVFEISNRALVDNSSWSLVSTSVDEVLGRKFVLGRKTVGSVSFNIWEGVDLDAADNAALDEYRNSSDFLPMAKARVKKNAKADRNRHIDAAILAAMEDPDDFESLDAARATLLASYSYLIGKGLGGTPPYNARKAQLEGTFEYVDLVTVEYRTIRASLDAASTLAELDAVSTSFTPLP